MTLSRLRSCEQDLRLFDEASAREAHVRLLQDWYDTDVEPGHYVHAIGGRLQSTSTAGEAADVNGTSLRVIDNEHGFLVVQPDTLLTGTRVADSFACLRRAVRRRACTLRILRLHADC